MSWFGCENWEANGCEPQCCGRREEEIKLGQRRNGKSTLGQQWPISSLIGDGGETVDRLVIWCEGRGGCEWWKREEKN